MNDAYLLAFRYVAVAGMAVSGLAAWRLALYGSRPIVPATIVFVVLASLACCPVQIQREPSALEAYKYLIERVTSDGVRTGTRNVQPSGAGEKDGTEASRGGDEAIARRLRS